MNKYLMSIAAVAAFAFSTFAEEAAGEVRPVYTNAGEIVASMIARLPVEPITLTGSIVLRKRGGIVVRECPFKFSLDWGASPAKATYSLMDAFGRESTVFKIERGMDGKSSYSLNGGADVNLADRIFETDLAWIDVTLSFLWWPKMELLGMEEFRGDECDVISAFPPEKIPGCASMKLWIDRKYGLLRQAVQIDESGKAVRTMWVASVGKINDRWMIRNMEVQTAGSQMRTKLHVDDLAAEN